MRIDNQQQQNKGVMDLMPQTGAVEEKNGIQMFADAVKTESSKKSAGTTSFQAKEVTYLNPAKEEKTTVIDDSTLLLSLDIDNGALYSCDGKTLEGNDFFDQIWERNY